MIPSPTMFEEWKDWAVRLVQFLQHQPQTRMLPTYSVSKLPAADASWLIYVPDEAGGAVVAFSDGTNWRRLTDRAIVS